MSHFKIIAIGTVTIHRFVGIFGSVRGVDVLEQQYQSDTEMHLRARKHVVDIAPANHEHWSTC